MKLFYSTLLLFIISFQLVLAQTEGINNLEAKYLDNKTELITNGRKLLFQKFRENDTTMVKELINYLITKVENESYLALYSNEKISLYYWLQDYSKVLELVDFYLKVEDNKFKNETNTQLKRIFPIKDSLYSIIMNKLLVQRVELHQQIINSNIKESKFVELNLDYELSKFNCQIVSQDYLNISSKIFLKEDPNSNYKKYVKKNIIDEVVVSNWSSSIEFFLGYGLFDKNLNKTYSGNLSFGANVDIKYKSVILFIRSYFSVSRLKDSILMKNVVHKKNERLQVLLPEVSVGKTVFDKKHLQFTPFVGISFLSISESENKTNKQMGNDYVGYGFIPSLTIGVNFDFKVIKKLQEKDDFYLLRIRYGYNIPQFQEKFQFPKGGYHYLTIGIGGLFEYRKIKRNKLI